jgi:hypothetical protein
VGFKIPVKKKGKKAIDNFYDDLVALDQALSSAVTVL